MVETANLQIPVFRFDAFSHGPLSGNPATVCPLDQWLADATMQAIAAEMSLSETSFFVPRGEDYDIRWFTPAVEVDLCGHATLASAAVVFERLQPGKTRVVFCSQSGPLVVARQGELLAVDLPALLPKIVPIADELVAALGVRPMVALEAGRVFGVFENSETIRSLKPNFSRLASLYPFGVGVSSPGTGEDADVDFVSRYFAPAKGVPEDPVTGSAHCTLTPIGHSAWGKSPSCPASQPAPRRSDRYPA